MVIAHLGHPWIAETLVLIRKHRHLYSDISALYYRPWQFYNALVLAMEYGVLDRLLFGTDYPFTTPASTIEALRRVNSMVEGTNLPRIPLDRIEAMIHRDALSLLGLDAQTQRCCCPTRPTVARATPVRPSPPIPNRVQPSTRSGIARSSARSPRRQARRRRHRDEAIDDPERLAHHGAAERALRRVELHELGAPLEGVQVQRRRGQQVRRP